MIKKSLVIFMFPFLVSAQSAFISGNDTICDNGEAATIKIDFNGTDPFTFVYAINGVNQPPITNISFTPYLLNKKQSGIYTLTSFADVSGTAGLISGSALVTILQAPTALFTTATDTLSILYPSVQLNDVSIGNITDWSWNFGDNTSNDFTANPFHTYKDSIGIYQLSLIVTDDFGCSDTIFKHVQITDDYWMYIPNSFTPDLDGKNDKFCISYHGVREETFTFNLYGALSELVYSTNNINDLKCIYNGGHLINGWDGKHHKIQKDLPSDTYVYEIYFQDSEGWKHTEYGTIVLVR